MLARQPVSFIERKCPDMFRVRELLAISQGANHWANGGPVSRLLERHIAGLTGNRAGRAVVACASGTAALNALAGIHALRRGGKLRWAVSAFGFFSTFIGPFHDPLVIDCDERGMLDLDELARADPDSYDGVCVTNLFGLHPDLAGYIDFCDHRGKALVVDNAYGLVGATGDRSGFPDEMISLHQTKPWGLGEGGCLIVNEEDEPVARSLINFGVLLEREAAVHAANGKMSDVAAAFILDRLEQTERWRERADDQARRIRRLVARSGLELAPLATDSADATGAGQLAFLAPDPVDERSLENEHFVIRKYYRPPWRPWPERASRLYDRMINLPCHADMERVGDNAILDVLAASLRKPAAAGPTKPNA